MKRTVRLVVGILGIMKAGGAYLPVEVEGEYPGERVEYMLEDAGVRVLLVDGEDGEDGQGKLAFAFRGRVVEWEKAWREIEREESGNLALETGPGNLAYVIYTSGSTGKPKAVMVQHGSLANLVDWHQRTYYVEPADRATQTAALGFDASVWEIWPYLTSGASLWIVPDHVRSSGTGMIDWLVERRITLCFLVTPLAEILLKGYSERKPFEWSLRALFTGGDKLTYVPPQARFELWNHYGPTENTVVATAARIVPGSNRQPPIGRPIRNTRVYILDRYLQPAPLGTTGEIYIAGAALARGYRNRPQLTAERFVANPYSSDGDRLYRSGDLARWNRDGGIEFIGRGDSQVKIRGFRIELGEIEAALRNCEGVQDAVVIAHGDATGDKRLLGYVLAGRSSEVNAKGLHARLKRELPEYMDPALMVLESWPLTPNGKIDRKALPTPEFVPENAYRAPRTPEEEILCELFAGILGVPRVGLTDNFFALGGHSLMAIRLVSRIKATFGLDLAVYDLFHAPSVEELSPRLLKREDRSRIALTKPLRPERLPMSYGQERLWFVDRLEGGASTEYNVPVALRLKGELDQGLLERALNTIVERHESLRTHFVEKDGEPEQVIEERVRIELGMEDVSGLGEVEREERVEEAIRREWEERFDLERGPVLRAKLLKMGEREHVLVRTMHHIVSDGWSEGVFHGEMMALYGAYREGGENPLEELPVQYADYALWQRARMGEGGREMEEGLSYWKKELDGIPAELNLPAERSRAINRNRNAEAVSSTLTEEILDKLKAVSRQSACSLYMTMLAAFFVLLSRYSGQDDIVVGAPIAGRGEPQLEGLIGFFVNMLLVRGRSAGSKKFSELLAEVRLATLSAYRHQDVPFERIVEELAPRRNRSETPFVQVVFAQNVPRPQPKLEGLEVSNVSTHAMQARFDLEVHVGEYDDGLRIRWVLNRSLFGRELLEQMTQHYACVLAAVAGNAAQEIQSIAFLSGKEIRQILEDWNATQQSLRHETVVAAFEAQTERRGLADALTYGESTLRYLELNQRANRLARYLRSHHLQQSDVEHEEFVAILLPRSTDAIVALLATLKAGTAYQPLPFNDPPARLSQLIRSTGARFVLTHARLVGLLPASVVPIMLDDPDVTEAIQNCGAGNLDDRERGVRLRPDSAAYLMHTSGSTGSPKGVVVTHRGIVRLVDSVKYVHLDEGQILLQMAPLSFDASTFEIWGALLNGGKLVLYPDGLPDPEMLGHVLREEGINTLWLTASLFHAFVNERIHDLSGVRQLLAGGDVLRIAEVRRALESLPHCRMVNGYGPTEETTFSCCHTVAMDDCLSRSIPIGRPIENTRVYILGTALNPQPIGVMGELYIAGVGLARGYWNRSAQTAERFVADPFDVQGERMYRTGDLARWNVDGTVEFLGRVDGQLKVRGFRVELGEVEAALCRQPGVVDAVVIAREDRDGNRDLVAYIGSGERELHSTTLRQLLAQEPPEHMLPSAWVVLPQLPLSPNGKVDRNALPSPRYEAADGYRAPRTQDEEMLCALFEQVLGVEPIGLDDNFFELGGHSLMAMRLVSRIRSSWGVELGLDVFFELPTVAQLALRISRSVRPGIALTKALRPERLPMSYGQERLWFVDRLEGGASTEYNVPVALRLKGELDRDLLERALNTIVERHESLRTHFVERDGEPEQVIEERVRIELGMEDVSGLGEVEREERVEEAIRREWEERFDLERGPVLRAKLLKMGEREHVLVRTMHHIVSDGWSEGIFHGEMMALYGAYREGGENPLEELPVQYADYALWQRARMGEGGREMEEGLSYWKKELDGIPAELNLPAERSRAINRNRNAEAVSSTLTEEILDKLKAVSRQSACSLYMTMLAAFFVLLSRYSGQDDIVVGAPIAGRGEPQLEGLIGFFVNMLLVRGRSAGSKKFSELLAEVRLATLSAYRHQDVPFERIVEELAPRRNRSETPFVQVVFAQNVPRPQPKLEGLEVSNVSTHAMQARFDLEVHVGEYDDGLRIRWVLNRSLFGRELLEQMTQHYACVLAAVAGNAAQEIQSIAFLSGKEIRQILEDWNATQQSLRHETVVAAFEAQTERRGLADALTYGESTLRYLELNQRANRLARYLRSHHLQQSDVEHEEFVAILLPRSTDAIVALLATLKAGTAYQPLPFNDPPARLSQLIRSTGARFVLTHARLVGLLPASVVPIMLDDPDVTEAIQNCGAGNLDDRERGVRLRPDSAAYLMHTSGSTGSPKGVVVTHRGIVRLVDSVKYVHLDEGQILLQMAPLSFDASTFEIWGALLNGGKLVLYPDGLPDPEMLGHVLREEGINTLWLTASLFHAFVNERIHDLSGVRQLLAGGDVLRIAEVRRALESLPHCRMVNGYGPTEATTFSCCHTVAMDDCLSRSIPIGRPIENTRVYILGTALNPQPIGVMGELYIAGVGLARGYWNRSAQTAERFVADPFDVQGERMYRTGDLARWNVDGTVEFLGRVDGQLKVRGFRVELGEVEAALCRQPGVVDAVVIAREDRDGNRDLVAYIGSGERELHSTTLRQLLAQEPPEHMLPSAWVVLPQLPLSPNGKVDRNALPSPRYEAADGYRAPRTQDEEMLCALFEQVLGVEPIGLDDNFFELGGHSLMAMRLVSRIRSSWGV